MWQATSRPWSNTACVRSSVPDMAAWTSKPSAKALPCANRVSSVSRWRSSLTFQTPVLAVPKAAANEARFGLAGGSLEFLENRVILFGEASVDVGLHRHQM